MKQQHQHQRPLLLVARCLAAVIAITGTAGPLYAQRGQVDVAFVMDGSGSISAADFQLQKEGIATSLLNTGIVPRDRSFAVSVVQFAGVTTRTEVPYTLIDSKEAVDSAVARVRSIVQIGGNTNPGDGINSALAVLASSGRPQARQAICLSTDGTPTVGSTPPGTAIEAAKRSQIGLDQFGVIAIECPPAGFTAATAHQLYDPLVFGGGSVTVVRNSVEFAFVMGATCLSTAKFELVGLEVNQAVQDWKNSVPLVAGKDTLVRAHLQPLDSTPAVAVARLRGFRNGSELAGSPLAPGNSDGGALARPNTAAHRADLTASLNFTLPSNWLSGDVEFLLEGVGANLQCKEAAGTPNDCRVRVQFRETDTPEVKFFNVTWQQGTTTHKNGSGDIVEETNRLRAIFPVAALATRTGHLNYSGTVPPMTNPTIGDMMAFFDRVNAQLQLQRYFDFCFSSVGCDRLYYGVVPGPEYGGKAEVDLSVFRGAVASGSHGARNGYFHNVAAHELGHDLGREHAVDTDMGVVNGEYPGPCGEAATTMAPDFPFISTVAGVNRATLGPMSSGNDELIFGFDNHRKAVIDPSKTFELMSYCSGISPVTGASSWISSHTYTAIRDTINQTFRTAALAGSGEYLIVRGMIDLDRRSISWLPFAVLQSQVAPDLPPEGNYELTLYDNAGGTTAMRFDAQPHDFDPAPGIPGVQPRIASFLVPMPNDRNFVRATVSTPSGMLGQIAASGNAPSVAILFPNGGENLNDAEIEVTWRGSDADGDSLQYILQYSADGGATWDTLGSDIVGTSYRVPLAILAESSRGVMRVQASDGFHTASDVSDATFFVPNKPPSVHIDQPDTNDAYFGVQLIPLRATATDREDGALTGNGLRWTSNRNGPLGGGASLSVDASNLSEGAHVLTVTATDSGGLTASDSVSINVFRAPRAPECGDGLVTLGEQCDDNNQQEGDGCDSNCTDTACGNGIQTAGEQCDDGNLDDGDNCSAQCRSSRLTSYPPGEPEGCAVAVPRTIGSAWLVWLAAALVCGWRRPCQRPSRHGFATVRRS